ncbi:MAG: DUF1837 domain-containing protein [Micrococcaceae bacterium]
MDKKPLLIPRGNDEPEFCVFCVGYELSRWRAEELVRDFFQRHLTSFALNYSEWKKIDGNSAAEALSRSANMVYTTDKYDKRGDFGELFLHGILRDFYNAEPAVSKIYFKDAANDTVKGFDSVHVVVDSNKNLDLWLGEAKLYTSKYGAVRDAVASLKAHVDTDFLRREFIAITNKFDDSWPYKEKLADLLDKNTSLDLIMKRLVLPIFITYQSDAIANHDEVNDKYIIEFINEAKDVWEDLQNKLEIKYPLTIYFIALPLENTKSVRGIADDLLKTYQKI